MKPPPAVAAGEPIDATCAWLVLYGALSAASAPSCVAHAEWGRLLAGLDPRESCVLVLRGVRGLSLTEAGEWLGISRACVQKLWLRALERTKAAAIKLTA